VLGVKAPGYGDRKNEMLEDIAIMTGGEVISEKTGLNFEKPRLQMLGRANKVVATKDRTVIVGGKGGKKEIESRVAADSRLSLKTRGKFDKEKSRNALQNFQAASRSSAWVLQPRLR
jgi:chaperonin GroEL